MVIKARVRLCSYWSRPNKREAYESSERTLGCLCQSKRPRLP
ncbi:hypothetical protein Gogos_010483 [Gossypium gossypioides]|uniref:Uncharacterized protein n=1 Tax=Gossypium gossypioides TaxID=34282 RepID=A0A7J9BLF5_GOSGO|nr:hypothetical protein [Gossypium gossypioides]